MSDDQDVCEWVFLLVLAYPGSPGSKAIKRLCALQQTVNQTMLYSANPHTKFNQFKHANSVQMVDSVRSSRQQKDHVCHILDT